MKKGIAFISFLCYFGAASGIVINSHYCMKRLVSVHLFESKAKVCGRCGMKIHKSKGCCKDEVKVIKMGQDQNKIPVTIYRLPTLEPQPVVISDLIVSTYNKVNELLHFHNHSPPLLSERDTYLRNNVFRI